MTRVNGTTDDGGAGTGPDGHRCVVDYSITQDIVNNKSVLTYSYGVDYGDPNYWNNINHRSFSWAALQGTISASSGGGTSQSTNVFINTSDPGYGGQLHFFGGVWSGTITITHDSNGEAVVRLNAAMEFNSGANDSDITNHDITLPDIVRPPVAPGTPTGTRVNDEQIDLSWVNNSAAHFEYASQRIQRSVDGGAFATIASGLAAGATSYSDTSTSANHKYVYRIQAVNAAGSATSASSSAVYTTPGTPTIGTASKLASGNVELSWANNIGYGDTNYGTDIYESVDGGAFSYEASVSGGLSTWEHVAPDTGVTHAYKVLHTRGALFSSLSAASNTVTLLSTAGAPTGLSPSGAARDAADDIVLSWTHNPTDGTPQSKRRVQVKVNAGSYSDAVNDTSGVSSYTIAGGTWSNGDTITWKVSTAGENGTLGTDSAEASFTLSAKPTVTINSPDTTYETSSLLVEWGYFQAQSSAQATWQAWLYDDADALLETISGTTETEGAFTYAVQDGETYTVTVSVTSAAGVASELDSSEFTVAYLPPAAIAISGTFDDTNGSITLELAGEGPVTDVTVEITSVDVQRKIDDGEWVTILTGVVLDGSRLATVQDTTPITVGTNTYRAIAHSALPSSTLSPEDAVAVNERTWGYLSGGAGFVNVARLRAMPTFGMSKSRAKAVYHFAGRPKPVQLVGEALSATLNVSGKLTADSSTVDDFEALAHAEGVHCWRGPDGRRVFGSLGKVDTTATRMRALPTVSFSVIELDYTEGDQ